MASKLTLNAESKRGMATNLLAQQGTEKEKVNWLSGRQARLSFMIQ